MVYDQIGSVAFTILSEVIKRSNLQQGSVVIIGCSTSEVMGERIGTASNMDIASSLYTAFTQAADYASVCLAFQCCEHLNRAIVLNRDVARRLSLEPVHVVPVQHAGGAMAATAFSQQDDAVVVETLNAQARAGLDIGDTFIGMHIHPVVAPLRLELHKSLGMAHITAAYSRPKLIGGARAIYE